MAGQEWFVQSTFAHIAEPLLECSACFMLIMVKGKGFALQIFLKQRVQLNLEIQV